ncbi:hypothetical protein H2204_001095 [Knufia peltigerae]|uniref:Major facilitator superfamily (MFS) profile domain-containing protein n=1 Tax=Knufia peltigerae TaxID=1002370 RepID=A0AA39D3R2_9EURO|nr:hypothetical protein H2204_001095 [Knufia peltigerae]
MATEKDMDVAHVEAEAALQQSITADEHPGKNGVHHLYLDVTLDPELERQLTRKIDFRLLPILTVIYMWSLIDRTNIGVARISGIDEKLGLNISNRASVASKYSCWAPPRLDDPATEITEYTLTLDDNQALIVYLGYAIVELPSNIALRKFGAANWISFLCLGWGFLTFGIGFSKSYSDLVIMRAFLGAFEGGLVPGLLYLLASWYRPYEVQKRLAAFFLTGSFLASFASILAYGLIQVADDPANGGWKWIYIIEGCLTIGVAIVSRFILLDFPDSKRNKFLSPELQACLRNRLLRERGEAESPKVTWSVIKDTLMSWPVWSGAYLFFAGSASSYGFLIFLPLILRNGLGYSLAASFCLTTPPAALSIITGYTTAWLSDKYHIRGPFVIFHSLLSVVGLAMMAFLNSPTPRYVGSFLGYSGTYGVIITGQAWGQNNIRSDAKRAVGTVIQVVCAAIGGIYSALVFRQQDAPNYIPGMIATLLAIGLAAVVAPVSMFFFRRENRLADAGLKVLEGAEGFRYTL